MASDATPPLPASRCSTPRSRAVGGVSLALPVLPGTPGPARHPAIAKSRVARWRALSLVTVSLVMVIHLLQWVYVGMTVSPVEPSESVQTIQTGVVNAGAVFFTVAILSTLLFGRFFCGWGCHIVALQDLCGHAMTKLGVRPKPFRSRLLVFIPLGIALYMFVWPSISRQLVEFNPALRPWLGEPARWLGWSSEFIVQDFWGTFAPWYIAIPFLAVCGFASVYFLGNKGFCTYGCPYGGFFAPVDLLAPGKIRVTDDCEQCGHCTAVCTSNVRVHEEVRDYGMVVDPGCMKCLDCVSVCPKDALYVGLGRPTVLARPRDEGAKARRAKMARHYDFSRREELVCSALFILLFLGYRGFMNQTPLLMGVGIAAIGAFSTLKLWRLARDPSVRLQNVQLRLKGRLRPAGFAFAALVALVLLGGAWGLTVRWTLWRAGRWDDLVRVPREEALSGRFTADARMLEAAHNALAGYERAGPFWHARAGPGEATALGWSIPPVRHVRMAYLCMVLGERDEAEAHMRAALESSHARDELVIALLRLMELKGADESVIAQTLEEALARQNDLHAVRLMLAGYYDQQLHQPERARGLYESALADRSLRWSARLRRDGAAVFINTGGVERGVQLLDEAVALAKAPGVHDTRTLVEAAQTFHDLAAVDAAQGRGPDAIVRMTRAAELDTASAVYAERLAELLSAAGRTEDAAKWLTEARKRNDAVGTPK
jgi:polyferredoxin/tetratricopeptide (TPR) repeat protein